MHQGLAERWNSISLRTKITAVTVLLLTLGLLVSGIGTMTMLKPQLVAQLDAQLADKVQKVATDLSAQGVSQFSESDDYYGAVYDSSGKLVYSNAAGHRPRLPLADPSGPPASALPHVSPRQRSPPASHGSPRANRSARSLTRKSHPVSAPLLPSFFFPAVKPAPLLRSVAPRRHSLPRGPPQLRRAYRPASPSVSPSRSFPTQARRSRAAVVRSTLGTDHGRNCRSRF